MSIASRVEHYLVEQGVEFDVISHPYSSTSMESAQLAHVPGDCIAKSVVLEDDRGYVLAVLPASCPVERISQCRDSSVSTMPTPTVSLPWMLDHKKLWTTR